MAGTVALFLTGCATGSGVDPTTGKPDYGRSYSPKVSRLIERAQNLPSPESERLLLEAVRKLRLSNQTAEARRILDAIDFSTLPPALRANAIMELALIALATRNGEYAVSLLSTDIMGLLSIWPQLPARQTDEISLVLAQAWEATGNYFAAARERISVDPTLSPDQAEANRVQIWNDLLRVPNAELLMFSQGISIPEEVELKAWLELAWINKAFQDALKPQIQMLKQWQKRYPNHSPLPESLRVLPKLKAPSRIALILPANGKLLRAAKAISNGFAAAHYSSNATPLNAPDTLGSDLGSDADSDIKASKEESEANEPLSIKVYDDSPDTETFLQTYEQAIAEGAEIIVGPLHKQNVKALQNLPGYLAVPTLALNYGDPDSVNPHNLYQFGLNADDDARQVADRAWFDGHRDAAVLYPDTAWGRRVLKAFTTQWSSIGGQLTASTPFVSDGNYSSAIKQMLLIQQSEARASNLKKVLQAKFGFEPRRRKDIDFIFVIALPDQARQIKPLLDFHYAASIPVYAGSRIYSGLPNKELYRDLNGIEFCEIPWLLNTGDKLRESINHAWPSLDSRYFPLNALGVDAYRLTSRLDMLTASPQATFFGATGSLSINEDNRIVRSLIWARMEDGYPKVTPVVVATPITDIQSPPGLEQE